MCERFKDASVIQTVACYTKILYAHHWKDTPCRAEKNPTMTKIVLLWLLSKTIVNVSYLFKYLMENILTDGQRPLPNSVLA